MITKARKWIMVASLMLTMCFAINNSTSAKAAVVTEVATQHLPQHHGAICFPGHGKQAWSFRPIYNLFQSDEYGGVRQPAAPRNRAQTKSGRSAGSAT